MSAPTHAFVFRDRREPGALAQVAHLAAAWFARRACSGIDPQEGAPMHIEQSQWSEFFAELSRQAEGYDASIEVMSGELGYQVEVRRANLLEVAFDAREGISISVGDGLTGHDETLRHVIPGPVAVETSDEPGVPAALMIEDANDARTLVRLAAPPVR